MNIDLRHIRTHLDHICSSSAWSIQPDQERKCLLRSYSAPTPLPGIGELPPWIQHTDILHLTQLAVNRSVQLVFLCDWLLFLNNTFLRSMHAMACNTRLSVKDCIIILIPPPMFPSLTKVCILIKPSQVFNNIN